MISAPPIEELQLRLNGYALPSGSVRLEPYEVRLGDEAMRVGHAPGPLNPAWILVAGLRGMGVSIDELVGLAGSRTADGVLFGELGIEETVPLETDREYLVKGRINGIARRTGRSGVFDVLTFELAIDGRTGERHGLVTCAFILPRVRT